MVLISLTLRQGDNISCPELPYVEETDYFFEVLKVRSLVLVVRAVWKWGSVWSNGGTILTVEKQRTRRIFRLCAPFVHHKTYVDRSGMDSGLRVETSAINPLTPNDHYSGRTAPLTSKRCILYIYSTNIGTEYFKHGIYSPVFFFSSKCSLFNNSNVFGSCINHILYTGRAKN